MHDKKVIIAIISILGIALALALPVTISKPSLSFGEPQAFEQYLDSCVKQVDNVVDCFLSTVSISPSGTGTLPISPVTPGIGPGTTPTPATTPTPTPIPTTTVPLSPTTTPTTTPTTIPGPVPPPPPPPPPTITLAPAPAPAPAPTTTVPSTPTTRTDDIAALLGPTGTSTQMADLVTILSSPSNTNVDGINTALQNYQVALDNLISLQNQGVTSGPEYEAALSALDQAIGALKEQYIAGGGDAASFDTAFAQARIAIEAQLGLSQMSLVTYCMQNPCSPNIVFDANPDYFKRPYRDLTFGSGYVLLELKPEYLSLDIQSLAQSIAANSGVDVETMNIIDLPGYKAISANVDTDTGTDSGTGTGTGTGTNTGTDSGTGTGTDTGTGTGIGMDSGTGTALITDDRFQVILPQTAPGQGYLLQVKPNAADVDVGQIANMPGVVLIDYFSFGQHSALAIKTNSSSPLLSDERFLAFGPLVNGHIAQTQAARLNWTETLTTGFERTGSPYENETQIDVDIAVLDSGVSLDHPDLFIYRNISLVGGASNGDDDNGHGSHVAGIAAALDNGVGIVGEAPGARIWAVKVCDKNGECNPIDQLRGIRYAIQHADEIDVLNISIENPNLPPINNALAKAVEAGITVVVSAGNYAVNANATTPANSPSPGVLTVSAIGDSDGKCGGTGPSLEQPDGIIPDDRFAFFSNYGPNIDVAAPGVEVLSTFNGTDYGTQSGTSMAAPHVTGAAALYKFLFPEATPAQVVANITASGSVPTTVCEQGPRGYFEDDLDSLAEPLLLRR